MEDDRARCGRVEHVVDDDTMEVKVRVESGTEPMDEGNRAEAHRRAGARATRAQAGLHGAQEYAHSTPLKCGVELPLCAA